MSIICGRPYKKAAAPVSATGGPGAAQVAAGEHKPMACREVDGLHVHAEGDQPSRQHTRQFGNPWGGNGFVRNNKNGGG